ncbi:hypothetical protein M8818_005454 [Zalaria obscura]|uniref:Uncharacterized protein n=1 Tax=Zalaria obscura TaxID=2024903 RepID=A0ACC3S7Z7_9PEZI
MSAAVTRAAKEHSRAMHSRSSPVCLKSWNGAYSPAVLNSELSSSVISMTSLLSNLGPRTNVSVRPKTSSKYGTGIPPDYYQEFHWATAILAGSCVGCRPET